ncbi:hypothetical protein HO133_005760 [Letharia lupina]|uniref:Uncharacterized protein n=1 Tax=Letharia lupina TaxID=560253 RepID=A0A8H6C7J2_9LECA|nr:uncharacterized protein HO133_005760 [Letharia lupina]KAF6218413.1 hypothetical protein HO133_005760 [Letharia lupina]
MQAKSLPPTSSLTILSSSQSAKELDASPTTAYSAGHLPSYRAVKNLPYELREHCMIYLEEGLHCQALNLLTSLLTSGSTSSSPLPAFLPPPHYLALIATLAVHPTLTTRAKTLDRVQAANLALRYLRLVLKHAGPVNGNLNDAFTFNSLSFSSRRGGSGRRRTTGEGAIPPVDDDERIDTELANAGSLWAHAEGFWHVVGWCFNCSILHKRRWERWNAWLTYMIEVLEVDWDAREHGEGHESREKSLIMKYINSGATTAGRQRHIIRAVFADGRTKSVAEFGEIWKNETKELKKDVDVTKAEKKIDIEADNYGDYMEDEDDEDLADSPEDLSPPPEQMSESIPNVADDLGGMDSVNLRLRLLSLLSKVSAGLPDDFTDLNTLYDNFLEHIRSLPIPAFFLIISPTTLRVFTPAAASSLAQYILRSLIAASAPLPLNDNISQDILGRSYLPFPANTTSIVDNTKVSLCVETLLRLLDHHIGLAWTPGLHEAAEAGIKARTAKAKKKQTKRGTDRDWGGDGTWLAASAERIRGVVGMAKP